VPTKENPEGPVLTEPGSPPRFDDTADPEPAEGQAVVEVTAAGVHHLDLAKASGTLGDPPIPSVPGPTVSGAPSTDVASSSMPLSPRTD
jgi:D-arabinose 1-dehydrogenase-like Zn-dependent alcohol dehydrogenase